MNSTCIAAVHNVLQPQKTMRQNFSGALTETHQEPASRSLSQVLPSSSSTILIRSSCSIRSYSTFSNLTVLKHKFKFTLSSSFLSTEFQFSTARGKNPANLTAIMLGQRGTPMNAIMKNSSVF